jgi:hypothetical protein
MQYFLVSALTVSKDPSLQIVRAGLRHIVCNKYSFCYCATTEIQAEAAMSTNKIRAGKHVREEAGTLANEKGL